MTEYVGVPRHCVRCNADLHMSAEDQPHLCADIARRLARRERQVSVVIDLLTARRLVALDAPVTDRQVAESIVKALANLGVTED